VIGSLADCLASYCRTGSSCTVKKSTYELTNSLSVVRFSPRVLPAINFGMKKVNQPIDKFSKRCACLFPRAPRDQLWYEKSLQTS